MSSDAKPTSHWKNVASFVLRAAITLAAFVWLFRLVDVSKFIATVKETNLTTYAAACGLYATTFAACCGRWYALLQPVLTERFARVVRWVFMGAFFNTLLPTIVGGDVVRIYEAKHAMGDWKCATATVLLDRMLGFTALMAFAVVAVLICLPTIQEPILIRGVIGFAVLFFVVALPLVSQRVFQWLMTPLSWPPLRGAKAHLEKFHSIVQSYGQHKKAIRDALILSFFIQATTLAIHWVVALALGIQISFWVVAVIVPIMMAIAMLPISLNGLGLREAAAVILLAPLGVSEAQALAFSLLSAAIPALFGLAGGLVFLTYKRGSLPNTKLGEDRLQ